MAKVDRLIAVRVVTDTKSDYDKTVSFYRDMVGEEPAFAFESDADATEHQAGAYFVVGNAQLIVTLEASPTPEAKVDQSPVWICFGTDDPDGARETAEVSQPVVDTSFGTRGYFVNDPVGNAIYVGTEWQILR